jgi:hypothetical protein
MLLAITHICQNLNAILKKENNMEYTNIIRNGTGYINVYNNGNLGLPMIANIPMENEGKVLALYGNQPNFTIEYCGCRYIMNWVVGKEPNYFK